MPYASPSLIAFSIILLIIIIVVIIIAFIMQKKVSTTPTVTCTAAPEKPLNVSATVSGPGQVLVAWAAAPGASAYRIFRGTVSNFDTSTADIKTSSSTSFTYGNLNGGVQQFFVVTAINSCGESAQSDQVSAQPPFAFPPTFVIAYRNDHNILLVRSGSSLVAGTILTPAADRVFIYNNSLFRFEMSQDATFCIVNDTGVNASVLLCNSFSSNQNEWNYNLSTGYITKVTDPSICLRRDTLDTPLVSTIVAGLSEWDIISV